MVTLAFFIEALDKEIKETRQEIEVTEDIDKSNYLQGGLAALENIAREIRKVEQ